MNRKTWFVLLVFLFVAGCDQSPTDEKNLTATGEKLAKQVDGYAVRAADNSWPPIGKDVAQISSNLTAPNYYLVVDGSGSMLDVSCADGDKKINVAKLALASFVKQIPDSANLGMFTFDASGRGERVPLGPGNKQRAEIFISSLKAGGDTPLAKAVYAGYAALTKQARRQLGYGEYHLVVVTDGQANEPQQLEGSIKRMLEKSPVVIHTVGFCIDASHTLNQPGQTIYQSANDPKSLRAGLQAVLAEAPDFQATQFNESTQ